MCRSCLPRRAVLAAALLPGAAGASGLVEPALRLPGASGALTVAVTLDACPGGFDARLIEGLIAARIRATLFLTGLWIARNPGPLALLLRHRGLFRLENHGQRHVPAVLGGGRVFGLPAAGTLEAVRREVVEGAQSLRAAAAVEARWYRGATGLYSREALGEIAAIGFAPAGYSLNADAGASLPANAVAARLARAVDGDVIIGHMNQPQRPSGAGLLAGVLALQQRGAVFAFLPDPPRGG